jgi:hypothetical protein
MYQHRAVQGSMLLQVMIVVLLIALGASLMMPRLLRRSPDRNWQAIEQELTNILYFARQEAVTTQKVHRVVVDKKDRTVFVEVDAGEEKPGVRAYAPVQSYYMVSRYQLPEGIAFISCKRGKADLFEQNKGKAFCYVMPHGLVQELILKIERVERDEKEYYTLATEPFLGSFVETAGAK